MFVGGGPREGAPGPRAFWHLSASRLRWAATTLLDKCTANALLHHRRHAVRGIFFTDEDIAEITTRQRRRPDVLIRALPPSHRRYRTHENAEMDAAVAALTGPTRVPRTPPIGRSEWCRPSANVDGHGMTSTESGCPCGCDEAVDAGCKTRSRASYVNAPARLPGQVRRPRTPCPRNSGASGPSSNWSGG
jgi:hypothetical protein